jgi:hypothetical protein
MSSEKNNNLIASLEKNLAKTLMPVKPSTDFVRSARKQLHFASPVVVAQRITDKQYVFIAIASVVSIALVVITGVRAIFYFTGRAK